MRGDLDWIVMKAMEKDRRRRYETANGLARDVERHLNNEAIVARPPNNIYRLQKLIGRNRLLFASAAAVTLVLIIALVVSIELLTREKRERRRAVAAEYNAQVARANESAQRQLAKANEKKAHTEAVRSAQEALFMEDMLKAVGPGVALGRDTKLLEEILTKTAGRLDQLTNQPLVEADLRSILGDVYYELGEDGAIPMYERALALRKENLGSDNAVVAKSLYSLAEAMRRGYANDSAGVAPKRERCFKRRLGFSGNCSAMRILMWRSHSSVLPCGTKIWRSWLRSESFFRQALKIQTNLPPGERRGSRLDSGVAFAGSPI